jgi:dihydrolipoamide dehydrogenase
VIKDGEIACRIVKKDGEVLDLTVDLVMVAVGMVPNTADLGLAANGIELNEKGFIKVNEFQQTSVKNIYAIGDVAGRQLLAHKASAEAEVAIAHAMGHSVAGVNYGQIPGCTYCFPQIASVGLTEKACKEKGLKVKIGRFPFQASGKARAIGHTDGFVKLIYGEEHGELLGAHMIGPDVTEMLAELGLALKLEATWEEIGFTVHAHPTLSEAVMEATWDSQGACVHT